MRFKIKDTGITKCVVLQLWHNGFNGGWGTDDSQDVMASGVEGYELDEDGRYIVSQAEFDAFIDWWRDEVKNANADPYGYCGDGLSGTRCGDNPEDFDDSDPDPDEWFLFVWDED